MKLGYRLRFFFLKKQPLDGFGVPPTPPAALPGPVPVPGALSPPPIGFPRSLSPSGPPSPSPSPGVSPLGTPAIVVQRLELP